MRINLGIDHFKNPVYVGNFQQGEPAVSHYLHRVIWKIIIYIQLFRRIMNVCKKLPAGGASSPSHYLHRIIWKNYECKIILLTRENQQFNV